MIHSAPSLDALKARAKRAAMAFFVSRAEADGVPPTLRAMYVLKASEARTVAEGGTSALIVAEAADRGVPPADLARTILAMAQASHDLELARIRVGLAVEGAADAQAVVAALTAAGIALPPEAA